ncbi:hypothetical protein [Actinokineospora sp. NBRC 105648]|uniref:hypothetical protein n=1 Tax=Actinokineospora sp. NBRC 105648 TaxID=3032206 RepID=UPI0024A378DB|nr:hypothetical protein [Actinokineospora sp. NBRC 105648]GLZ37548.1 hypothetical protein Acsp05_11730 [Actinokineospora sp. NBRC 105648]
MSDDLGLIGDLDLSIPDARRAQAARVVAACSTDAAECAELLAMLGLSADGGTKRDEHRAA